MLRIEQNHIDILEKIKACNLRMMGRATFFQGQEEENDHTQLQMELILLKSHDLSNICLQFINPDADHLDIAIDSRRFEPSSGPL